MGDTWTPRHRPAHFPGLGLCFYESGPKRPPLMGEFFAVRGRPIQQWTERTPPLCGFPIYRPTHRAEPVTTYRRGAPIL